MAALACDVCGYDLSSAGSQLCPECGSNDEDRLRFIQGRARLKRRIAIVLILVSLSPFMVLGLLCVWMEVNFRLHVGYFGRFNRTIDGINDIPSARVLDSGGNRDLGFEEIWAEVQVEDRFLVRLFIPETVELSNATSIVVRSVNNLHLGSQGLHPDWSGPELTLGPAGNARSILQGPETLSDILLHIDSLVKWVESTPLDHLQEKYEPKTYPASSVLIEVWDTTVAKPPR